MPDSLDRHMLTWSIAMSGLSDVPAAEVAAAQRQLHFGRFTQRVFKVGVHHLPRRLVDQLDQPAQVAQWLLAHTGHRPDVLPAPLLATLHSSLINTPGEMRSGWRRERLHSAGYALGWRTFDYAGHDVVFHAGAVQGYRGLVALVPERDLGIAIMWNGESGLPSGLLPTVLDAALGLPSQRWLDVDTDFGSDNLMAEGASPAQQDKRKGKGASSNRAVASPR